MPKMTKSAARRKEKLSRKINKSNVKGKYKRAQRLAKRQEKIVKTGKRGAGRTIDKAKKLGKKVAESKVGIVAKGAYDLYKKGKKMDVAGVARTVKSVSEKLKAKKKKAALSSLRKKAVKKKPVNKRALAKRKAIIKRVRKAGEAKVSASYKKRKVPTAKLSTKGVVRKLNAASRKSMKADSKDMKRNKLAAELKKKLGAKKYEVLRTKKLKGLALLNMIARMEPKPVINSLCVLFLILSMYSFLMSDYV